jgi:hypothetical protein
MTTTISERYSRRPKLVPPASKTDLVVEVISFAGLVFTIGLVIYGSINLPENIPRHVGLSGAIDGYGTKWIMLVTYFTLNIFLYTFLTIITRYPYSYNYPVTVTEENAPGLYRLACSMMRWIKAIFVWMIAAIAWEFIAVLPYNPGQSGNSLVTGFIFTLVMMFVIGYYVVKIFKVSLKQNTTRKKGY